MRKVLREKIDLLESMGVTVRVLSQSPHVKLECTRDGKSVTIVTPSTGSDRREMANFRSIARRVLRQEGLL